MEIDLNTRADSLELIMEMNRVLDQISVLLEGALCKCDRDELNAK